MENIAIISSMRIKIIPFTISMLFELFQQWYNVITWQFNLFFMEQVIKDYHTQRHQMCSTFHLADFKKPTPS
jgi:hypothetical protein